MEPIRVLVVDDSAVMRGIMTRVINSQPDMQVAAVVNYVRTHLGNDYREVITTEEVAPLPEYAGTVTLLVQTRSPKDRVLAAIDSLDVEAVLRGNPANPAPRTPPKKRKKSE